MKLKELVEKQNKKIRKNFPAYACGINNCVAEFRLEIAEYIFKEIKKYDEGYELDILKNIISELKELKP